MMMSDKSSEEEASPPRHHLIEEAVKFLTNPKVASHSDDKKYVFLKKKGLNDEEISAAFSKAKTYSHVGTVGQVTSSLASHPGGGGAGSGYLSSSSAQQWSVWVTIRDVCNIIVILGGASYGLHYLYRNYIGPWLTGRREKTVEDSMVELQQSVVSVLKEVQNTLASLDRNLSAQALHIQSLTNKEGSDRSIRQLDELRNEVSSMKGLLINKRTFPSTPAMAPSIPTWQRNKTPTTTTTAEKPVEQIEESAVSLSNQVELLEEKTPLMISSEDLKYGSNGETEIFEEIREDSEVTNGDVSENVFHQRECEA